MRGLRGAHHVAELVRCADFDLLAAVVAGDEQRGHHMLRQVESVEAGPFGVEHDGHVRIGGFDDAARADEGQCARCILGIDAMQGAPQVGVDRPRHMPPDRMQQVRVLVAEVAFAIAVQQQPARPGARCRKVAEEQQLPESGRSAEVAQPWQFMLRQATLVACIGCAQAADAGCSAREIAVVVGLAQQGRNALRRSFLRRVVRRSKCEVDVAALQYRAVEPDQRMQKREQLLAKLIRFGVLGQRVQLGHGFRQAVQHGVVQRAEYPAGMN